MPELPDVEIYKRMADQHALHRVVDRLVVNDPGILEDATGAALQQRLKGKRLSSCRSTARCCSVVP
jgi:formamidopyrimidine-DNA glycosylase